MVLIGITDCGPGGARQERAVRLVPGFTAFDVGMEPPFTHSGTGPVTGPNTVRVLRGRKEVVFLCFCVFLGDACHQMVVVFYHLLPSWDCFFSEDLHGVFEGAVSMSFQREPLWLRRRRQLLTTKSSPDQGQL